MKRIMASLLLSAALAGPAPAGDPLRIGVSMTSFDNPFLTILLNGIKEQAGRDGVELVLEDAQLDVARQQSQVQNFIANGVQAIILNAVDGSATPAMTAAATQAGVPLVYVNHPPAEEAAMPRGTSFVGSDEKQSGTMQTEAVCKALGGKGDVLVLMGPLENAASLQRTRDIEEVLATPACSGMKVADRQVANWSRTQAQDLTTNWLTSGIPFDAVIANNDEMAIGAIQALKSAGADMGKVVVAGIDATPDGLAAMKAGDLDVTIFQDAGKPAEPTVWVPFEPVTTANLTQYENRE